MKTHSFLLIIFLLIVLLAVGISITEPTWKNWRPATCLPDHCFCERRLSGAVAQPSNTFSNLGFVAVGLFILFVTLQNKPDVPENLIQGQRTYPLVYSLTLVMIGLGSMFYHASLTFASQWVDVMGMYLLITFVLFYTLARWQGLTGKQFAVGYLLSNLLLGTALIIVPQFRRQIFGLLALSAVVLEIMFLCIRRPEIKKRFFWSALAAFAAGFIIWNLDHTGIFCHPESWLQGHAIWHLLSAEAAWLLYLYYRSEKPPSFDRLL